MIVFAGGGETIVRVSCRTLGRLEQHALVSAYLPNAKSNVIPHVIC